MMRATIDLIGMYTYDKTLLDLLVIPQALDKEVLKDNLLMEAAELELLYTDPNFLKMAIGAWSRKQLPVWVELYDTTQYEYNPIWNKDGKIVETRDLKATEDVKENVDRIDNLTDKTTRNLKDENVRDFKDLERRDLKDETLNSVYGFNSSDDAPANKDESKATGTDTMEHTGKDTYNHTGTDTIDHTGRQDVDRSIDRDTTDTGTVTRVETGNIGVTSTQSLIMEQREVVKLNVMDVIIHDFINRFCLKIY